MWAAGHDVSAGVEDIEATIKTLIEHGAALDLKDDRGKTAADIARDLGHERAAKLLERWVWNTVVCRDPGDSVRDRRADVIPTVIRRRPASPATNWYP